MSIISDAKDVVSLIKKLDDQELYQKILDLQSQILELSSEIIELKNRNTELTEKLNIKENMNWQPPFYFKQGDSMPYCQLCFDSENQTIHLVYSHQSAQRDYVWNCPKCSNKYITNEKIV